MPRKLIFETWRERFGTTAPFIFEIDKFNPTFPVRRSNRILKDPDYQIVFNMIAREFAQVFCVSTEAMRIRLEKLGLLLREVPPQRSFMVGSDPFF
jgi:hypothetical protein